VPGNLFLKRRRVIEELQATIYSFALCNVSSDIADINDDCIKYSFEN
jgi:hypothetical protein